MRDFVSNNIFPVRIIPLMLHTHTFIFNDYIQTQKLKKVQNIAPNIQQIKNLEKKHLTKLKHSVKSKNTYIPINYTYPIISKIVFPSKLSALYDAKSQHKFY